MSGQAEQIVTAYFEVGRAVLAFSEGFTVPRASVERRTAHDLQNIARPAWVNTGSPKYRKQPARDWCERNVLMFFGGRVAENLYFGREPSFEPEGDRDTALVFASSYVGGPKAAEAWVNWLHIRAEQVINSRRGAVVELAGELAVRGGFDLRWCRYRVEQAVRYDRAMAAVPATLERERLAGVLSISCKTEL